MNEIQGMIKNGIERGWQSNEIKQSLVNAGYSMEEVNSEMASFLNQNSTQPIITSDYQRQEFNPQNLNNYQMPKVEGQKKDKKVLVLVILAAVVGLLAVVSLALVLLRK